MLVAIVRPDSLPHCGKRQPECMAVFAGPSSQSSSNAGPSLPPRKAKTEEQSGVSEAQAAQPQTRQQGVAASTPQGSGLSNGTAPSAPSSTGNGPTRAGAVTPARNAGPVSSGGAGGDSSRGASLSVIQAHAFPTFCYRTPALLAGMCWIAGLTILCSMHACTHMRALMHAACFVCTHVCSYFASAEITVSTETNPFDSETHKQVSLKPVSGSFCHCDAGPMR